MRYLVLCFIYRCLVNVNYVCYQLEKLVIFRFYIFIGYINMGQEGFQGFYKIFFMIFVKSFDIILVVIMIGWWYIWSGCC